MCLCLGLCMFFFRRHGRTIAGCWCSAIVIYIFTTTFADNHGHTRAPFLLFLLPFSDIPEHFLRFFFGMSCQAFALKFEYPSLLTTHGAAYWCMHQCQVPLWVACSPTTNGRTCEDVKFLRRAHPCFRICKLCGEREG